MEKTHRVEGGNLWCTQRSLRSQWDGGLCSTHQVDLKSKNEKKKKIEQKKVREKKNCENETDPEKKKWCGISYVREWEWFCQRLWGHGRLEAGELDGAERDCSALSRGVASEKSAMVC